MCIHKSSARSKKIQVKIMVNKITSINYYAGCDMMFVPHVIRVRSALLLANLLFFTPNFLFFLYCPTTIISPNSFNKVYMYTFTYILSFIAVICNIHIVAPRRLCREPSLSGDVLFRI